jgi:hypothetical protein
MLLICKKIGPTKDRLNLTIGKEYNSIGHTMNRSDETIIQSYRIINDAGLNCYYDRSLFYSLDEIREQKLNKLGL